MNRRLLPVALAASLYASACSRPATPPVAAAPATVPALTSGIALENRDPAIRPQDDLYGHVNGHWVATTEIPADRPGVSSFSTLNDTIQDQLHGLVDSAAGKAEGDAEQEKIAVLYGSFMDEAKIEELGLKPLEADFASVDAVSDKADLADLLGTLQARMPQAGTFGPSTTSLPLVISIHQDNKDATHAIAGFEQSGLGMPDRDYYLKSDDAKLKGFREAYLKYVETMLGMTGDKAAAKTAKDILALETALAQAQWSKVELRDPVKAYNKIDLDKLAALAPGFDWPRFITASGLDGKVTFVIVGQPSYLKSFATLIAKTPLPVWKAYFKWHLLNERAQYLPKAFVDARFAFYGTTLRGTPENRPRWKRGVSLVETLIGEALGKVYTAQYFPPENKARAEALVSNLLATYKQSIDTLDWMGPETKKEAQAKLAKIQVKIGYPDAWRDYSTLSLDPADLIGNLTRAYAFEYDRVLAKLGAPLDRKEWGITPQTVNAYYDPERNEIVFPAAILQPPFFDAKADDAANYGGIGAVIGHEISHGFDDQGAQYDGDGNLRQWFTADDLKNFKAKTAKLVAQYNAYESLPGYHVNGELTLGENIADNSGMAIAWKAWQRSLAGKPAATIDGLSGPERFYFGFAQIWREKLRDNTEIEALKIDPHSPGKFRTLGTVVNQPGFYETFGLKQGDKQYLPPEQRVSIW